MVIVAVPSAIPTAYHQPCRRDSLRYRCEVQRFRHSMLVVAVVALVSSLGAEPLGQRGAAREPDIFFVPTSEAVADEMLQLGRITSRDVVYDLGSGDGRILILAAQKYGARGVGIELQPHLVERARAVARDGEVTDRVRFVEGDLFTADISEATLVTIYLSPGVNARLESKLRTQLRPGTRIVSHQFTIGTWTPDKTMAARDGTDLYLWTVPAR